MQFLIYHMKYRSWPSCGPTMACQIWENSLGTDLAQLWHASLLDAITKPELAQIPSANWGRSCPMQC